MINVLALKQARDMFTRTIKENPTIVLIYRDVYVSDGFGGEVIDPFNVGAPVSIECRISHEKKAVEQNSISPVGLSTNLARYISVAWNVSINENEVFEAMGRKWRIGPVDRLEKFGGVVGYQAPLKEAEIVEGGET